MASIRPVMIQFKGMAVLVLACLCFSFQPVWGEMPYQHSLNVPLRAPLPQFEFHDAFPGHSFTRPVGIYAEPATESLWIIEQGGNIFKVYPNEPTRKELVLDLSQIVWAEPVDPGGEAGLLGLAFHPDYLNNQKLYIFYNAEAVPGVPATLQGVLSEIKINEKAGDHIVDYDLNVLISQADEHPWHNAGDVQFGPDGYLYVALGDEGLGFDHYKNSQRIDKDFFSGIIRIDVDNKPENLDPNPHPAIKGRYKIPNDNPFIGVKEWNGKAINPEKLRTEFYYIGLRNPFRFSIDPKTGVTYINDVGQGSYEEINVGIPGANYGWAQFEGTWEAGLYDRTKSTTLDRYVPPIFSGIHKSWNSITASLAYRGHDFEDLHGGYLYSDFWTGRIEFLRYIDSDLQSKVDSIVSEISSIRSKSSPAVPTNEELNNFIDSLKQHTEETPIEILDVQSENGTDYQQQPDGSYFIQGQSPWVDKVSLEVAIPENKISQFLVRIYADSRLPAGGPGNYWAGNVASGNFVLTDIKLEFGNDGNILSSDISNAYASYNQGGWEIANSIDTNLDSGWGIFDKVGEDHWAAFTLSQELSLSAETKKFILLDFNHGVGASFGKFGLFTTQQKSDYPNIISENILFNLHRDIDQWSAIAKEQLIALNRLESGLDEITISEEDKLREKELWNSLTRIFNAQNAPIKSLTSERGISSFGVGPDGNSIYGANWVKSKIMKLTKKEDPDPIVLPEKLSETGFFTDMSNLDVVSQAVPYSVVHPFWSDGADKKRWVVALKSGLKFQHDAKDWTNIPSGAAWVKHFDYTWNIEGQEVTKKVETRFLIKTDSSVHGLTYRWNQEGTDATLVDESGASESLTWNENDQQLNLPWRFPGRNECLQCHTPEKNGVLGFVPIQLNLTNASDGQNQLDKFHALGFFDQEFTRKGTIPKLVALDDKSASLQDRVISYLDVNCSSCHLPNGSARAEWDASIITDITKKNILGIEPIYNFGDPEQRLVLQGKPEKSVLYNRIAQLGSEHMPPLATQVINQPAVDLLRAWISHDTPFIGDGLNIPPYIEKLHWPESSDLLGGQNYQFRGFITDSDSEIGRIEFQLNDKLLETSLDGSFDFSIPLESGLHTLLVKVYAPNDSLLHQEAYQLNVDLNVIKFESIAIDSNGNFSTIIKNDKSIRLIIETSSDLKTWAPIDSGNLQEFSTKTNLDEQFLRIRIVPQN